MDWNNSLQSINLDELAPSQMEWLTSTFSQDLEDRVTRLEKIDDQRKTDSDGRIRRFTSRGNWKIHSPSSLEVEGMSISERVARLEQFDKNEHESDGYMIRRRNNDWAVDRSAHDPSSMNLYDRIVRLEQILLNWDTDYDSRYYDTDRHVPFSGATRSDRPVDRSPPDYRPKIESPWKFVKPSEYTPSPGYKPLSDYTLYKKFFEEYGFMPYNQLSIPDEEKHALIVFQRSIKSYLDSMSAIANKYKEVKSRFCDDRNGAWNTPFGQKYTQLQSDELQFLKLIFYELAKIACRRFIISSVHSIEDDRIPVPHSLIEHNFRVDETIDMRCLYHLIKESEIVDDHRSSLLSFSRLRHTALRRALSERIIFTVRDGSPRSVRIAALKTDRLKYYVLPQVVAHIHQAVRIQECHGGYCDFDTARALYRQFYDKYKDLTPDDFHRDVGR